jgi:hypothetical protein
MGSTLFHQTLTCNHIMLIIIITLVGGLLPSCLPASIPYSNHMANPPPPQQQWPWGQGMDTPWTEYSLGFGYGLTPVPSRLTPSPHVYAQQQQPVFWQDVTNVGYGSNNSPAVLHFEPTPPDQGPLFDSSDAPFDEADFSSGPIAETLAPRSGTTRNKANRQLIAEVREATISQQESPFECTRCTLFQPYKGTRCPPGGIDKARRDQRKEG